MIYFCAQAVCKVLFSYTFPTHAEKDKNSIYMIWVLNVQEGVKLLWVTESFRQFCNKHDIRIKWVRKFPACCTSYTSFGKFGTRKTNGRVPKTRFSAISCFFETLAHTWIKLGDSWLITSVYVSKSWYSMPMAKQTGTSTRTLPFRATKPTQEIATREQIELHPSQRDFSRPISHIYW